jgi:NifU-like protein involved in Fe-S cluster formation
MPDADSVGTVGSPDCGDMLRMWLKFTQKDGKKVIDRATFQSFGCQTAIAVASMATELLKGKTIEQARAMSAEELSGDLGIAAVASGLGQPFARCSLGTAGHQTLS